MKWLPLVSSCHDRDIVCAAWLMGTVCISCCASALKSMSMLALAIVLPGSFALTLMSIELGKCTAYVREVIVIGLLDEASARAYLGAMTNERKSIERQSASGRREYKRRRGID